jgi:signal transduction histidine kinase
LLIFRSLVVDPLDKVRSAILEFRASGKAARAREVGPVEIREIARALNETTAALAEDRKRQLAFVAGVAHDLKSPLTALTLAVSLLEDLPPSPQSAAAKARALRQIAGNTTRLRRMVDDLMDVTRSEVAELALDLADVDLRGPARDVVDLHFVDTGAHSIVLTVPEEPVPVRGDAARIEQALVNLVSNAIKYSPGGGKIRIEVARTPTEAVLSVSDEGVGIPENELPMLFEPFHRGTVSRHVAPGAGLGLSILARIVRAHGGRVQVESELGAGSCFRVFLPLASTAREDRAPHPP